MASPKMRRVPAEAIETSGKGFCSSGCDFVRDRRQADALPLPIGRCMSVQPKLVAWARVVSCQCCHFEIIATGRYP
jgi:hypothetical protein